MPTLPRRLPCRASRERQSSEAGVVSLELAAALPVVLLILMFCLWGILAGSLKLRCDDAARASARALARGDNELAMRAQVIGAVRHGATMQVHTSTTLVKVTVTALVPEPKILRRLVHPITVSSTVTMPRER
jgi:hypothetical protein